MTVIVVSSIALIESAEKSCDNSKVEEVVEEGTKPQEGEMIHFTHASESFRSLIWHFRIHQFVLCFICTV